MSENLLEALLILAVGMITVFIILGLVVLTGEILIRITNRFAPRLEKTEKNTPVAAPLPSQKLPQKKSFEHKKLAVIIGAVEAITQGRGRINEIKKL